MPSLSNALRLGSAILGGGVAYDADSLAFFTRESSAGYTMSGSEMSAVDTFIASLKTANIYTKIIEMWLMIGGTAGTHALGFKNAFNLTFVGSPTHSSAGVAFNGTTQYARTGVIPSTSMTVGDAAISYYTPTDSSTDGFEMGASNALSQRVLLSASISNAMDLQMYSNTAAADAAVSPVGATKGYYLGSRTATNAISLYKSGVLKVSVSTVDAGTRPTSEIYLGAFNSSGAPAVFSPRGCQFAHIGSGLNSTEAGQMATAVNTLQTSLSRNVY
jgi:hypothetical protein